MENKTKFTVTEAEKLTGYTRQTIGAYIKSGKLSAEIGPNGKKIIDLSEIHRVFGDKLNPDTAKTNGKLPRQSTEDLTSILRSEIERLVREIDVIREERDAERRLREIEIERAAEERKEMREIFKNEIRMLTAPKGPEPKKTFWQRIFSS